MSGTCIIGSFSEESEHMAGRTLTVAAVFAILSSFFSPTHSSMAEDSKIRLSEIEDYITFFRSVIYRFQRNGVTTVARWEHLTTKVCIFGNPPEYSRQVLDEFFSVIVVNTILKFDLEFTDTAEQCGTNTMLYVRFHSGGLNILESLKLDVSRIAQMRNYTESVDHLYFHEYGMGLLLKQPATDLFAYAAIDQFDRNETAYDKAAANNAIQQELFQILTLSVDKPIDGKYASIIHEPTWYNVDDVDDATEEDTGSEPKYRKKWVETYSNNLCLYDVMLLLTLYGPGVLNVNPEGDLDWHEAYIREHFDYLKDRATIIMNSEAYNQIFMKKC
jgi:hypothetical protein